MEDGVEMDGSSAERGVVSSTQHLLWTTYLDNYCQSRS